MKNITKEIDPDIVYFLKPYFTEDGCYNREIIADELNQQMVWNPDKICVLIGWEDSVMKGFLIAYVVANRDYACIDQAYSMADKDFSIDGMNRLVEWAKGLGLKEIRFETEKKSVEMATAKRYGFTEHGVIMTKRLENDTQS